MNEVAVVTMGQRFNEIAKASEQFAKSSIIPSSFRGKPADVFVALEWGTELGLQPMAALQNIYVVNGRPTLSSQCMAGLVKGRADYMGMKIEANTEKATATITRKLQSGATETHTGSFSIKEAQAAGLTSKDNWKAYPQQMLEARAVAFAMRKAYPDILMGVYTKEELEDIEPRNITPEATDRTVEPIQAPAPEAPQDQPEAPQEPAKPAWKDEWQTRATALSKEVASWPKETRDALQFGDLVKKAKENAELLDIAEIRARIYGKKKDTDNAQPTLDALLNIGQDLAELKKYLEFIEAEGQ